MGKDEGGADEGRTLRERAGPRPLTVASRYCSVPQSLTARLKRSSRYCKEERRTRGHLGRSCLGARDLWVPAPAPVASALSPEDSFALCTLARGNLYQVHIFPPVRTHCAHPPSPRLCPQHVCTRLPPTHTHTHSWPTAITLDFNHFAHCLRKVLSLAGLDTWESEHRPAPRPSRRQRGSQVWNFQAALRQHSGMYMLRHVGGRCVPAHR